MSEKTSFRETIESLADSARSGKIKDRLNEYYEQLAETPQFQNVKHAADSIVEYIQKHPIQSALVALGVGFVIGLLVNRRSDS
ncbi:MAG: hypothetical protein RMI34_12595 [Chloroherpetonaceae bacterium]|nr:hypothetical protein [Chloroherpetonaceae bacterium]MCS7211965.1 hypothetical protein [Chloroherpetonaceae bacterium]MDW8020896.1 hypothetical protein [Chloroherpetonaceae bacterium]MDW8466167.1 hypothetical protein [Chloroherpetonaceae bacterium]